MTNKHYEYEELTKIVNDWVRFSKIQDKNYGECKIEDAGDGSGDGILTFPEGLCEDLGWREGDTLKITVEDENCIIFAKVS